MTVTTAAIPADTGGGGIRLNSILKDGGNQFSGSAFMGGTKGTWVQDNIDDELRARNLERRQRHRSPRGVHRIARRPDPERQAVVDPLGSPSVDRDHDRERAEVRDRTRDGQQYKATNDLYVRSLSTRLTWQAAEKYKVAGFLERWWHKKGHSIGAGTDSRAGEQRDPRNAHHAIGNMKLTAPVTNKWLVEAGYSFAEFYWKGGSPSGTPAATREDDFPFTPEWYATAPTTDTALNRNFADKCMYALCPPGCTAWNATREQRQESVHNEAKFMASYVTGSHNIKVGFENRLGSRAASARTRATAICSSTTSTISRSTVEVFNNPDHPAVRTSRTTSASSRRTAGR